MSGVSPSRDPDRAILDLLTVGRVNLDLYSQQIGVPFEEVTGFEAMVGGSPTNIAIGTARLGLRSAAFTAVGEDQVGDLVLHRLAADGVDTRFVLRKPGHLSSLALLGVEPPDHFPLMFYRSDPADIHLTIEDAASLPLTDIRAIQHSGNAFSRGDCAETARWLVEEGQRLDLSSFLDLDMRPAEWPDPRDYGRAMRFAMVRVDVVIGTYEELWGALAPDPKVLIADEPTSSIDQSAQAQLLNLLRRLQSERELAIIFISHDLGLVRYLTSRVYVMQKGDIVEAGKTQDVLERPQHSYTRLLIDSIPGR